MDKRIAVVKRKTSETDVSLTINIDGRGNSQIDTGIGFLDHMLTLFAKHGLFDLKVKAKGDTHVDMHHTVEDIGICLGEAFYQALGKRKGIRRYGLGYVPMDETLCRTVVDLSNRPYLIFNVKSPKPRRGDFDIGLTKEFLKALSNKGGITLHVNLIYGENGHHINEAIFKSLAIALDTASVIDKRIIGLPSTKGRL